MDTNNHKYKLTFWSSIKPFLWPLFVTLFFVIGFMPILAFTANSDSFEFALIVSTAWLCITGIPPLVLEINYLFCDWNTTLKIDHSNGIIEITKRNDFFRFQLQDIIRIEKHHSGIEKGEKVGRMHWHTYYYYKVYVRNQEPFFISRMIIANLEENLENVKCVLIWRRFPMVRN